MEKERKTEDHPRRERGRDEEVEELLELEPAAPPDLALPEPPRRLRRERREAGALGGGLRSDGVRSESPQPYQVLPSNWRRRAAALSASDGGRG